MDISSLTDAISYAFNGWTVSAVMLFSFLIVGTIRAKYFKGVFLNSDTNIRDSINGVGLYILAMLLFCIHYDRDLLAELTADRFGAISVNASFGIVILTRIEALVVSARNGKKF